MLDENFEPKVGIQWIFGIDIMICLGFDRVWVRSD